VIRNLKITFKKLIVVSGQVDVPLATVGGGADVAQPPLPGLHLTKLFSFFVTDFAAK
jgi:hypothetical protein